MMLLINSKALACVGKLVLDYRKLETLNCLLVTMETGSTSFSGRPEVPFGSSIHL